MARIAIPLEAFKTVLLAVMTLSTVGLARQPKDVTTYANRMDIDIPLDLRSPTVALGHWISGHRLVDILCRDLAPILPSSVTSRGGARATLNAGCKHIKLVLPHAPSAHEILTAVTLLEETLQKIGVAPDDIADLLELRS